MSETRQQEYECVCVVAYASGRGDLAEVCEFVELPHYALAKERTDVNVSVYVRMACKHNRFIRCLLYGLSHAHFVFTSGY